MCLSIYQSKRESQNKYIVIQESDKVNSIIIADWDKYIKNLLPSSQSDISYSSRAIDQ